MILCLVKPHLRLPFATVAPHSLTMSTTTSTRMTVDQLFNTIGFGRFQWFLIVVAGCALIGDATEMMLLSMLGPIVHCFFNVDDPELEALLTTVVFVGMSLGGVVFGALADRLGRRIGLFATALLCSVGGVLSAIAPTFAALIVFRFIVGLGLGGVAVAFTYVMEFIPDSHRGFVGTFVQGWWTIGTFIQVILAWSSFQSLGWRWVVALSSLPIFIMLSFFCFVPESPRFLALKGKQKECKTLFLNAALKNGTSNKLPADFEVVVSSTDDTQSVLSSFKEAFSDHFRRDTILLLMIWFANAMTYYGLVLLTTQLAVMRQSNDALNNATGTTTPTASTNATGLPNSIDYDPAAGCGTLFDDTFFAEIMIATVAEMPGLLASILLVDRMGRKKSQTLFFGMVTVVLCILALVPRSSGGDTFLLFLARGSSMAAFTIVFLYTPERYPTRFRNTAMGMCFGFARVGGMISPLVCQDLPQRGYLPVTFAIMCTISAIACGCTYLLTVETSGKTLNEVQMTSSTNNSRVVVGKSGVDGFTSLTEEEDDNDAAANI